MGHWGDVGLLCGRQRLIGMGAMEGVEELEVTVAQDSNNDQEEDD